MVRRMTRRRRMTMMMMMRGRRRSLVDINVTMVYTKS
jgi:hypothetical protein